MIPQVLHDFGVFVDGKGYLGIAKEVELPKFKVVTEEHLAAGMSAPRELDMGLEKLEMKITFAGYNQALSEMLGLLTAGSRVTIRGALAQQNGTAIGIVIKIWGGVKESDFGTFKRKDTGQTVLTFAIRGYEETINSIVTKKIDVQNNIREIGGIDQMKDIRALIGQ